MSKYWGRNRWYYILRPYVDHIARSSFASIEVEGSVLDDGRAVIFAPNHTNTLLDPLVLLQHFPRKAILFGARADIFNKPLAAKLLHFLYMVPLARERDGRSSVEKNLEVFPVIIDVLKDGIPFCLFPEGAHKLKHTLRPLRKGTQRIAFENAAVQPTCVVPVGLEYSDFLTFRGRCKMRFGEPIDVNGFIEAHKDDLKSDQYEAFGDLLWNRMAGLINYIPEDENYEKRLDETMPVPPRPWWRIPLAVITLPFFVVAAALSLPMWLTAELLCRFKIKDKAFSNSVRFLCKLFLSPLVLILWAVLGFCLLSPLSAAALLVYFLFSYSIFYDWLNLVLWKHRRLS